MGRADLEPDTAHAPAPAPVIFIFFAEDRGLTCRKLGVGPRSHSRTRNRARGSRPGQHHAEAGDQPPLARARLALSWQASFRSLMARGKADMMNGARWTLPGAVTVTGS